MKNFDFKDITLIPKYFDGTSRENLDVTVKLGNFVFKNPVIPANMESVITEDLCIKLASSGYFYIMHRFNIDQVKFIKKMKSLNLITSISLGVKEADYKLVSYLKDNDLEPDFITIDIAHGHSKMMKDALTFYKNKLPNTFFICGNICTPDAAFDLEQWGADALKIGVAPGFACTTYMQTMFGSRGIQASTIKNISTSSDLPLIADGGITMPGEIVASIVLGATMCMCGNLLSGCSDSPGLLVKKEDGVYMEYYGSASQFNSGKTNRIEGTKKLVLFKDKTMLEQMQSINESLQSAISYSGGTTLESLNYVKINYK